MKCLSERELTAVALGDGDRDARQHVARCAACDARRRDIARDLARLRTVLGEAPPAIEPARAFGIRWTAVAAAAAVVLAVALGRHGSTPPAPPDDESALVLLDEVSDVMRDGASLETSAPVAATTSTCPWGDPLLGVGCEESGVTQVAWR
jgi:hypothetical protein